MVAWKRCGLPLALLCAAAAGHSVATRFAQAEEEPESDSLTRFSVSAEFIVTTDYEREEPAENADAETRAESHSRIRPNMEDSDFFLAFDRRLFGADALGGAAIRVRMEDNTAQPRLFAFLASPSFRLAFGRLRLNNKLIRFPTPRNEDLIIYTHILSGALGEKENSHNLYGDNVIADWYLRPSYLRLTAFYHGRVHSRYDADSAEYIVDDSDITPGGGFGSVYQVPESDEESVLRTAGALYDTQFLERRNGVSATLDQALAGFALRIRSEGGSALGIAAQSIRSLGLDDRNGAGERVFPEQEDDLSRERSLVAIAALEWMASVDEPAWRVALIYARKTYDDISRGTRWSAVPNLLYRISNRLDLMFQVIYTDYDRGLAKITGRDRDYRIQIGIAMEVEKTFNDTLGYDAMVGQERGRLLTGY